MEMEMVRAEVREALRPFMKGGTHECVHYLFSGLRRDKVLVLTLTPDEVEVSFDEPGAPFHPGTPKGTVDIPKKFVDMALTIAVNQQALNAVEHCLRRQSNCW